MSRVGWVLALTLLVSAVASPGYGFKKRGYFRGEFSYGWLRDDRLLVKLADEKPPQIFGILEANVELSHTFWEMLRLYTDTSLFFSTQRQQILVKFNEAIIQLTPHEYVDIWVGKKRVSFSPGLFFTPSDVLNPGKNPTDPTLQREGRYGAGFSLPFDTFTFEFTWTVWERDTDYGLPSTFDFKRGTYQARFYFNFWESDLNLYYAYADKKHMGGVTWSRYLVKFMEFHIDVLVQQEREISFLDSVKKNSAGLPLPLTFPQIDTSGVFVKALVGFRFDLLNDKGILNIEYYYNGTGLKRKDYARLLDTMEQLVQFKELASRAGIKTPSLGQSQVDQGFFGTGLEGQHHLIVSFQYRELAEVLDLQLVMIYSIDDSSFLFYPRIEWRIHNSVKLELGFIIPIGNKRSELGQLPYHLTGVARIWVYW